MSSSTNGLMGGSTGSNNPTNALGDQIGATPNHASETLPTDQRKEGNVWCKPCGQSLGAARASAHLASKKHALNLEAARNPSPKVVAALSREDLVFLCHTRNLPYDSTALWKMSKSALTGIVGTVTGEEQTQLKRQAKGREKQYHPTTTVEDLNAIASAIGLQQYQGITRGGLIDEIVAHQSRHVNNGAAVSHIALYGQTTPGDALNYHAARAQAPSTVGELSAPFEPRNTITQSSAVDVVHRFAGPRDTTTGGHVAPGNYAALDSHAIASGRTTMVAAHPFTPQSYVPNTDCHTAPIPLYHGAACTPGMMPKRREVEQIFAQLRACMVLTISNELRKQEKVLLAALDAALSLELNKFAEH